MRSSFRDWCSETSVAREVAEAALAHKVRSQAEAAYARSDLLDRRREVMQAWAAYLAGKRRDPEAFAGWHGGSTCCLRTLKSKPRRHGPMA